MNNIKPLHSLATDVNANKDTTWIIKPLNSMFDSLGELLFSWVNSTGYEPVEGKGLDANLTRACCDALGLPWIVFKSDDFMHGATYFENDVFVESFLNKHEFCRKGDGKFYLLDEGNRIIASLSVDQNPAHNVEVNYCGVESLAIELLDVLKANVKVDHNTETRTPYHEVVKGGGMGRGMMSMMGGGGGDDSLTLIGGVIESPRVAREEFYPYLGGSVHELFAQFMASDEAVLILSGPPGTGKTSAVSAAIDLMHILPIYAKKTDVIAHRDFVDFVFKASDGYMNKVGGTAARHRSDLFEGSELADRELVRRKFDDFYKIVPTAEAEAPRVPMIICEDADLLMTPRSHGNTLMGNLLNETDGISSNTTRKIVFLTNLTDRTMIEEALMREGRCFAVIDFRLLSPEEAVAARAVSGLPPFKEEPTEAMSLAAVLRKPRKNIKIIDGKVVLDDGQ